MRAHRSTPVPNTPTPTRSAPPLAEVRRMLSRYRQTEQPPLGRAGRPPVLNPSVRRRGD